MTTMEKIITENTAEATMGNTCTTENTTETKTQPGDAGWSGTYDEEDPFGELLFSLRSDEKTISGSTSGKKRTVFLHTIQEDMMWSKSSKSDDGGQVRCNLCYYYFPSALALQVHLFTQKHPPLEFMRTVEYQNDPKYRCTVCLQELLFCDAPIHQCFHDRLKKIQVMLSVQKQQYASPFVCVYCSAKRFKNRFALAIHIIAHHTRSAGKSKKCPICKSIFKTTNPNVIEMHGIQEHVPEIMMIYRRMKAEETRTVINLGLPHICIYPHEKYNPTPDESHLLRPKNCEKEFLNSAQLSAHLIAFHGVLEISDNIRRKFRVFCTYCRPLCGFNDATSLAHHVRDKHEISAESRAILATKDMTFRAKFNPLLTCFLCWTVFPSNTHLQAHISCAHLTLQWRACDSCGREYCGMEEKMSDAIMCLLIDNHEKRHAALLEEHMDILNRTTSLPHKVPLSMPKPMFFAEINILDWKKLLAAKAKPVLSEKVLEHFRRLRDKNEEAQTELLFLGVI